MNSVPMSLQRSAGSNRVDRLRNLIGDLGVHDRILVSSGADVRWLCGFTGSNGWLVVGRDDIAFLTDGRYRDQAQIEARTLGLEIDPICVEPGERPADIVSRLVPKGAAGVRVFFQAADLDVARFRELESALGPVLEPAPKIEFLRRCKDAWEIEAMARAAEIADEALMLVAPMLSEQPTERDVRDELEYRIRRLGAEGPSYDTIVASGPVNSAKPHHRPDSTVIEEGHAVVIDVGALVDGYHSDMTRTFLIGDVDPELAAMYDIVREAQSRAVEAVAPGVSCADVDRACRSLFEELGLEKYFIHGTGHGVGLAIHEEPFIGRSTSRALEPGDVVTVEPGLYRMGLGGVRIEDLLVVTDTDRRFLTTLPKDSPCLPSQRTI